MACGCKKNQAQAEAQSMSVQSTKTPSKPTIKSITTPKPKR